MKRVFLFINLAFVLGNVSFAQRDLITPSLERCQILRGDTIFFRYSNLSFSGEARVEYRHYSSEDNDYSNLQDYSEGYLSSYYHWSPKGKKKNGGFVYHGDYSDATMPYLKSDVKTNLKDIHAKPLIVIGTSSHQIESSVGHYYAQEIMLFNTAFNDTILYRWKTNCYDYDYSTKKCKGGSSDYTYRPKTIYLPKQERLLKGKLVGTKFYIPLQENDKEYLSDRIVLDGDNKIVKFREYTITDCQITYEAKWWDFSFLSPRRPIIELSYSDNEGKTFKYDSEYGKSQKTYSKDMIDSLENAGIEARKNAGNWVFKLKSVEKPKSQNVKKGKMEKSGGYVDNFMTIVWAGNSKRLDFGIINNTKSDIKIIWDEALMINPWGGVERVLHKNSIPAMLGTHQTPSIIMPSTSLKDFFLTEYYDEGNRFRSDGTRFGCDYEGQTIKAIFPIEVNGIKYKYTFTFEVEWEWTFPELHTDE